MHDQFSYYVCSTTDVYPGSSNTQVNKGSPFISVESLLLPPLTAPDRATAAHLFQPQKPQNLMSCGYLAIRCGYICFPWYYDRQRTDMSEWPIGVIGERCFSHGRQRL